MARRLLLVSLLLGLLGGIDSAQVAHEEPQRSKQALRSKRTPGGGHNTVLSSTILNLIKPLASSSGTALGDPQVEPLLNMVSGKVDLDPDAFRGVFESLRANMRNTTNSTMRDIEATQGEKINDMKACETSHAFVAGLSLHDDYVEADQAYQAAVRDVESTCGTRDRECSDRDTKAIDLHNEFDHVARTYHNHPVPTVFDLAGFYLKDSNSWLEAATEKYRLWHQAATLCASTEQTCSQSENTRTERCGDLERAGRNGEEAYDNCFQHKKGAKDGYDATIPTLVANQKSSIENLEKVLCIVEVAVQSHGGTPRTDGQMSCTDLGAEHFGLIKYKCECTSPSSTTPLLYSATYITELHSREAPDRYTVWDTKGCGGGGGAGGGSGGGGGGGGGLSNYVPPTSVTAHKSPNSGWMQPEEMRDRRIHAAGLDASTSALCYTGSAGNRRRVYNIPACQVLSFTESKEVTFGPRAIPMPPSGFAATTYLEGSMAGEANHRFANNMLLALGSSSMLHCWSFWKKDLTDRGGRLHCYVLEVSGDSITNADVAVSDTGKEITQGVNGHYPHCGMDRAADTNTYIICWQSVEAGHNMDCKLFSVSGGAVQEVGQETSVTSVLSATDKPNFGHGVAIAGLTGTSAVACSTGNTNDAETQCVFMSWTAGDLNSMVFSADELIIPVKSHQFSRTLSRLSDDKAVLCFSESYGPFQCRVVMQTEIHGATQFSGVGNGDIGRGSQNTILLGRNKAVTTYTTMNGHIYFLTMDIDETTNTVTQVGTPIQIVNEYANYGVQGSLGPDRAFSAFYQNSALYVSPEW